MPSFFPQLTGRIVFWAVVFLLLPSSSAAGRARPESGPPPLHQVSFGVDVTIETISVAVTDVLLLRFSRTVSTSVWGRPGDANLVAAIEGSFVGGATSLYDALIEGVHRLAPFAADVGLGMAAAGSASRGGDGGECPAPPTGASADPAAHRRTAIVAITDGIDSSSGHSMYQVELVTQAAGVPVFQIELTGGGRSTVTMRRTAPRMANPDNALKVGQQRRGGFGDRRQQPVRRSLGLLQQPARMLDYREDRPRPRLLPRSP